jgi:ankyrin repeat protein
MCGNVDSARELLQKGADIEGKGIWFTPLLSAAKQGKIETVRILLDHGAKVQLGVHSALDYAVDHGDVAMAELLARADGRAIRNEHLIDAARAGHLDMVRWLLDKGADLSATKDYGSTALRSAVLSRTTDVVKFLLERGADIEAKDSYGQTALDLARKYAEGDSFNKEVFEVLDVWAREKGYKSLA